MSNNIVEEVIESTLESIWEGMSDRSQLKAQATEAWSPTLSNVGTITELSSTLKEALNPVSVVQSDVDEDVPSIPALSSSGQGCYGKGKLLAHKSMKESLF